MSARWLSVAIIAMTWIWAGGVDSVDAQSAAKLGKVDKLVRVTYPVADLVMPIEDHSVFDERKTRKVTPTITKESIAAALVDLITSTVAKESWESVGGLGSIQYFPYSMAIVVHQRESVQEEIANLLAAARRLHELQVSNELRLVAVPPKFAARLLKLMGDHGQPVRALNREPVKRMVSVDEKCVFALLEMVQGNRSSHIMQAPKITQFNGQRAGIFSMTETGSGVREGIRCDFLPILDPERKNVRLALDFEFVPKGEGEDGVVTHHVTRAAGTFVVLAGRTILWHLGEVASRQQLFMLVTSRVIVCKEEEQIFVGDAPPPRGAAEEQSVPEPMKAAQPRDAKERAIEHRLRQPISLHFKEVPLTDAIKDLSIVSGIQFVPDLRALKAARVNPDAPVSINAENIEMKHALNLLLRPLVSFVSGSPAFAEKVWSIYRGVIMQLARCSGDTCSACRP